ncbi:MAG: alpha-mannosidase, partial [Victivallales bacterium]|nr:alpha-mannosidase [Victivallales bacterium]
KVGRTFSTQLRMMEEFPGYTYVQSAPVAYEYCREDAPEVYAQIKQRVAEGRWSAEGAMYVEADCNLIAGESIVRQLLYGKGFFQEEFGIDSKVLWLPDVFGFTGALPQLLKQAGVDLFFNTKIQSIDGKPNPYHNYWWEGIDGTRVMGMHQASYINWAATAQLRAWVGSAAAKGGIQESLVPFGFGDGGGGATVEDLELVKRWQDLPFMPELRYVNVHDFVAELGQCFREQSDDTPVQSGQLYLEAHRGTYTSVARIKYLNRHSENRLMEAELWSSLAALRTGAPYPAGALKRAWQKTLLNQFHDILPGSSIRQVYLDAERDASTALSICGEAEEKAMDAFAAATTEWTVSNSHSHPVSGYVRVPVAAPFPDSQKITDPTGHVGRLAWVQDVPAWSIAPLVPVAPQLAAFHWDGVELETPFWRAQLSQPTSGYFANAGVITSLYDKVQRRQLAKGHLNDLQLFADEPESCEVWEQNPVGPNLAAALIVKGDCQIVASGPLTFIFRRTLETARSLIRQDVCFHAFTPRIDCHTQVDWHERRTMLKAVFPFRIDAPCSKAETAFGFHSWENDPESPAGRSRFETPMHRWVSVADDGGGVALLNDCKYGYGASGGTVSLTLLKSAAYAQFHPEPSQANPLKKVTHPQDWADQGPHSFTYSLYPHSGSGPDGQIVRESHLLNRPLQARSGCPVASFISIDTDHVIADTLKAAEDGDGFVLRLYEALGTAVETSVVLSEEVRSLQP